jgi:hypothetical protein
MSCTVYRWHATNTKRRPGGRADATAGEGNGAGDGEAEGGEGDDEDEGGGEKFAAQANENVSQLFEGRCALTWTDKGDRSIGALKIQEDKQTGKKWMQLSGPTV